MLAQRNDFGNVDEVDLAHAKWDVRKKLTPSDVSVIIGGKASQPKSKEHMNDADQELKRIAAEAGVPSPRISEVVSALRLMSLHPEAEKIFESLRPRSDLTAPVKQEPLPTVAPATWKDNKLPGDTPISFILRHYKPWLGNGLARNDIKHLDNSLYRGISNWLHQNRALHQQLLDEIDLPTKSEALERREAQREADGTPQEVKDWWAKQASQTRERKRSTRTKS